MKKIRFTAALAAVLAAALMTGCSSGENGNTEGSTTQITIDGSAMGGEEVYTTRALEEGDILAINKLSIKSEGDTLPGGYTCVQFLEDTQQALYSNGGSRIILSAQNYKEDMQDLAIWADNACAMIRVRNITSACDTLFGDPQNVKVAGYDAIMYDYDIIQYEFIDNTTKQQIDTFKGRNYYFYTDQDAYVLMFDTNDETEEEQKKCFEEFVAAIEITPTEY